MTKATIVREYFKLIDELFITQFDESTLPESRNIMSKTHVVHFSKPGNQDYFVTGNSGV